MRRSGLLTAMALLAASIPALAPAATPAAGSISVSHPVVRWSGGPVIGTSLASCGPGTCDEFLLKVDVPRRYWDRSPGGILVRIQWADENDDLDLVVLNDKGDPVANSAQFRTNFEQTLVFTPAPGTYHIVVQAFAARAVTFSGEARIAHVRNPVAATDRNTMRFAPQALVDPQRYVGEPGIWADGRDVFVTGPWGRASGFVWRSRDAGRSFELLDARPAANLADPRGRSCSPSSGGSDEDVIVDRTGRIYLADLEVASVSVSVSTDHGNTWTCNAVAASSQEEDREWLAPSPTADGDGPNIDAYLVYRDAVVGVLPGGAQAKPIQIHLDITRDGGKTWSARATYGKGLVFFEGPVFTARDGTVYHIFDGHNALWLARSTDQGRTVKTLLVSKRLGPPNNFFVSGDVDAAGNVYVAWVDIGTWDVLFSYSKDKGDHWSTPVRLNPPASESTTMPWVSAGKSGDVAIAWYGSPGRYMSDFAPAGARWDAWVARSVHGDSSSPHFQVARMSETTVHFGPICTGGFGCSADRTFLDFFEIDIAPDGTLLAVFNDNGRKQPPSSQDPPGPYVVIARQTAGLGMSRTASVNASKMFETSGDARFPPHSSSSKNIQQLDFAGMPSGSLSKGGLTITLPLSSARNLTDALSVSNTLVASDAYWIAIWKANDRQEYAGVHVDGTGAVSFFGGDAPVGQDSTASSEHFASYPPTFNLTGRVDVRSGRLIVQIPLKEFHLRPGDILHGLQAFSMTGLLPSIQTTYRTLQVVDGTPSQTIRIG